MDEAASATGALELMSSPVDREVLAGLQTNLFMVFMTSVWRHCAPRGIVGLLRPESHFVDPKGGSLRRATYGRLRRHWHFVNELMLFEDIGHPVNYGIHVYGDPRTATFVQQSSLLHPETADQSLVHDGAGLVPGIQYPSGGWDLRPHRKRIVKVDHDVLADWTRLFDVPGTPAAEARLLRPVTTADLEALSTLVQKSVQLSEGAEEPFPPCTHPVLAEPDREADLT